VSLQETETSTLMDVRILSPSKEETMNKEKNMDGFPAKRKLREFQLFSIVLRMVERQKL
jgi:hypothetical protein